MENPDVIQRRREKILARQTQHDKETTNDLSSETQPNVAKKYDLMKTIE